MEDNQPNTGSNREDDEKILPESAIKFFQQFDPVPRHCIYLGATLHWFDLETLLAIIESDGAFRSHYFQDAGPDAIWEAFERIRTLPHVEVYPGRGYRLNDQIRVILLDYLWQDEPEFYEYASDLAVQYFEEVLREQIEEVDKGRRKASELDWGLYVEIAYHALIAYQDEAMESIDDLLSELMDERQMGVYDQIMQILKTHQEAGRAPEGMSDNMQYWDMKAAYANLDMPRLELLAQQILESKSGETVFKAEAAFLLGDGLRQANRYEEARENLENSLFWYDSLDDALGKTQAMLSLGKTELECENFPAAENHLHQALTEYVESARIPYDEEAEDLFDTLIYDIFNPEAWERVEWTFEIPGEETQTPPEKAETDASNMITYNIAVDEEALPSDWPEERKQQARETRLMVRLDVTLGDLWLYLGYHRLGVNSFDEAAACARLSGDIFADFDFISGLQSAVHLLQILGAATADVESVKYNRAFQEQLLTKAAERGDEQAMLYGLELKAQFYLDKMLFASAREQYGKALELAQKLHSDNDVAVCLDGLGRLNWTDGLYAEAESDFQQALQFFRQANNREGWASTLLNLSNLQLSQHRYDEALANTQRALSTYRDLEVFSGIFDALVRLAELKTRQNHVAQAVALLEEAFNLSQQKNQFAHQAAALAEQSKLYFSTGNNELGDQLIDRAVSLARQYQRTGLAIQFLNSVVYTLLDTAEYRKVLQIAEWIIDLDPEDREVYHSLGWALENLGPDFAGQAMEAYQKGPSQPPDDAFTQKGVANAFRLMGRKEEAQTTYAQIVERYADSYIPVQLSALGWCHYQLGNYAAAEEAFLKNMESNPEPVSDYFDLGLVYLRQGKPEKAIWAYGQGIESLRQRNPPHLRLGQLFVAFSDLDELLPNQPAFAQEKTFLKVKSMLRDALFEILPYGSKMDLFLRFLD